MERWGCGRVVKGKKTGGEGEGNWKGARKGGR